MVRIDPQRQKIAGQARAGVAAIEREFPGGPIRRRRGTIVRAVRTARTGAPAIGHNPNGLAIASGNPRSCSTRRCSGAVLARKAAERAASDAMVAMSDIGIPLPCVCRHGGQPLPSHRNPAGRLAAIQPWPETVAGVR